MAFDAQLASRIRDVLSPNLDVQERKMFGGLAFLVGGHMGCGIIGERLVVRVGPEQHEEALSEAHVRPMDFTGRPMRGFVYVEPSGIREESKLASWIARGVAFASSLPPK